MSRKIRFDWFASGRCPRRPSKTRKKSTNSYSRRPWIEPLEDRRLLSLTVNTLVDEADGSIVDGDISLRDAIALAPAGETIDFSVTGTINLTLGELVINKNLTINGPDADQLTIDAGGNDPTPAVNEGNGSRVFHVNDANSVVSNSVAISELTLTGADMKGHGGAIRNRESLTLTNCTITGNATKAGTIVQYGYDYIVPSNGGGIYSSGSLTITGCEFSNKSADGSGGGIANIGPIVNITSSTINGNTTTANGSGGAIWNSGGNLTLTGSTISSNTTANSGGGVSNTGSLTVTASTLTGNSAAGGGGGIFGSATVISSTISGNSADIGGGIGGAGVSLFNSTISGNTAHDGAGIFQFFGILELHHTTVASNTSFSLISAGGVFISGGMSPIFDHSIIADNTAGGIASDVRSAFGSAPVANYSLIKAPAAVPIVGLGNIVGMDPLLAPLADNGGPTNTHRLRGGSPAINTGDHAAVAGVDGVPMFEQRGPGFSRVVGGQIDIGSYETTLGSIVVDTHVDEDDGNLSVGDVSLREAIAIANGTDRKDTIEFAPALGGRTIELDPLLGSLKIESKMTIDASSLAAGLTIDGKNGPDGMAATGDGFSLFVVGDLVAGPMIDVELIALTLRGGDTPMDGGAIVNKDNLTVTRCTIIGNAAGTNGGGIFNDETLTITESSVTDNTAGLNGGGICNEEILTVAGCLITNNMADFGGGISNGAGGGASAMVSYSTVNANSSVFKGGGIYSYSTLFVEDSTIATNVAGTEGGGICEIIHVSPIFRVTRSTVFDNLAGTDGGGILVHLVMPTDPKPAIISNTTISRNDANGNGGGIVLGGAPLTVEHSTITLNLADADVDGAGLGGGIGFGGFGGAVDLSHTIVAANISGAAVDDDISGLGAAAAHYSLIGIGSPVIGDDGTNLIGMGPPIDPKLGPLADNGGATKTHALLAGSPAINAGDPLAIAGIGGVPVFDQRGNSYGRVASGTIDIGAFELKVLAPALPGDYNRNGIVDGADRVLWRNTLGAAVPAFSGADGDGDGTVDQDDYGGWRAHFGETLPVGAGSGASALAFLQLAFEALDEAVMSPAAATTAVSAGLNLDAAGEACLVVFEAESARYDSLTQSREQSNVSRITESADDFLSLLLAIDSVRRSTRQNFAVINDRATENQLLDWADWPNLVDERLTLALADWQ